MTYVEQAIRRAIEGGWQHPVFCQFKGDSDDFHSLFESMVSQSAKWMLDPSFWQAIGKSLGWDKEVNAGCCELCGEPMPENETMFRYHGYSSNCPKPPIIMKNWKKEWHNFIDHLIEGKSAESFFESLINVKG